MKSIILDIETLSIQPNALITEIGLVAFTQEDFQPVAEMLVYPSFFDQIILSRHICPDTIGFHKAKGTLPTTFGIGNLKESCNAIAAFIYTHKPNRIWIQGPDFDRPILENFFRALNLPMPWEYWRTSDSRTAWNLAFPGIKHDPRPHHAIPDCYATLKDLQASLTQLNCQASA